MPRGLVYGTRARARVYLFHYANRSKDTLLIWTLYSVLLVECALSSQNAVSLFIRLGFAHKKTTSTDSAQQHPSWSKVPSPPVTTPTATPLTLEMGGSDSEGPTGQRSPSPGLPPFQNHTHLSLGFFCHRFKCCHGDGSSQQWSVSEEDSISI